MNHSLAYHSDHAPGSPSHYPTFERRKPTVSGALKPLNSLWGYCCLEPRSCRSVNCESIAETRKSENTDHLRGFNLPAEAV